MQQANGQTLYQTVQMQVPVQSAAQVQQQPVTALLPQVVQTANGQQQVVMQQVQVQQPMQVQQPQFIQQPQFAQVS